jgi:hypothetical protein
LVSRLLRPRGWRGGEPAKVPIDRYRVIDLDAPVLAAEQVKIIAAVGQELEAAHEAPKEAVRKTVGNFHAAPQNLLHFLRRDMVDNA